MVRVRVRVRVRGYRVRVRVRVRVVATLLTLMLPAKDLRMRSMARRETRASHAFWRAKFRIT